MNDPPKMVHRSTENSGKISKIESNINNYVDEKISSFIEEPKLLGETTPEEKYMDFLEHNVDVKPLNIGNLKGIEYKDGGGYRVVGTQDGQYFQYHPKEKSHHNNDEYYKLSSGKTGKKRYDTDGNLIE